MHSGKVFYNQDGRQVGTNDLIVKTYEIIERGEELGYDVVISEARQVEITNNGLVHYGYNKSISYNMNYSNVIDLNIKTLIGVTLNGIYYEIGHTVREYTSSSIGGITFLLGNTSIPLRINISIINKKGCLVYPSYFNSGYTRVTSIKIHYIEQN